MVDLLLSNKPERSEVWEEKTGVSLKVCLLRSVFVRHRKVRHSFYSVSNAEANLDYPDMGRTSGHELS